MVVLYCQVFFVRASLSGGHKMQARLHRGLKQGCCGVFWARHETPFRGGFFHRPGPPGRNEARVAVVEDGLLAREGTQSSSSSYI